MDTKKEKSKSKPFNTNFLLLWQGQFVSAIGDSLYGIALGFWILQKTGSPAHMGMIMALTILPRALLSPFAGVVIDITNRKLFLILSDIIRGLAVGWIAFAAFSGNIEIWMVYVSAIIIGACTAYFNPCILTAIPDLVKEEHLMQANSMMGMAANFSGILGNALGGFIFSLFGAPILFAINSISYIFSAGTETFIRLPDRKKRSSGFINEMVNGFSYMFSNTGLKLIILSSTIINFFGSLCFFLLLPFCEQTVKLGPKVYGLAVAAFMSGIFVGMVALTVISIKSSIRPILFILAILIFSVSLTCVPIWKLSYSVIIFQFIAGIANSVLITIIRTTIQIIVPENIRGKIFSLFEGFWTLLMPLAFIVGGFISEKYNPGSVFFTSAILMGISFIPLIISPPFLKLIGNSSEQT
jgi:MFS family permease